VTGKNTRQGNGAGVIHQLLAVGQHSHPSALVCQTKRHEQDKCNARRSEGFGLFTRTGKIEENTATIHKPTTQQIAVARQTHEN